MFRATRPSPPVAQRPQTQRPQTQRLQTLCLCTLILAATVACDGGLDTKTSDASSDEATSLPAPIAGYMPVDPARKCPSPAPEWHCMTPWPSNFHRAEKPSGGARLTLPKQGVPTTEDGERVDLITDLYRDGTSILPQIIVRIPGGIDDTTLIGPDDNYDDSLRVAVSPTLIVDTVTGKPVAHFAEVDPMPMPVEQRALILRPLVPLQWGRRYVVVVQRLTHPNGATIARAPTFDRIFRGATELTGWQAQQADYYKRFIHPTLTQASVQPSDVLLAWDFTTAHKSSICGRLTAMAKNARQQIAAGKFGAVTIDSMKAQTHNQEAAWWIRGKIALPAYISGLKHPSPHKTTSAKSTFQVPFAIMVSQGAVKLLATGGTPPVIIMGHGFFGNEEALLEGGYRHAAQAVAGVAIGIPWWGLSMADAGPVVGSLVANLAPLRFLLDRLEQGLVNVVSLAALTRRQPNQQKDTGDRLTNLMLPGGSTPIIQAKSTLSYYGASLGHILGSSATALSPDIERAAVQVGGAGWGMIMPRSQSFGGLLAILAGRFTDQGQTLLATLQLAEVLAAVDPISWATELRNLPNGKKRPLLLHAGPGDASVPVMTAELHARALGLPLLTPAPRKVWGLTEMAVKGAISGFVEVDFGVANPAVKAIPPNKSTVVHNGMRGVKAVRTQVGVFLSGLSIPVACTGVCDPN